jgi:uncharacterized protein with FMN-binding domain
MSPQNKANSKVANSLVAMSSAAVLAVYSAGYVRTRASADRFALMESGRRPDPAKAPLPSTTLGPGKPAATGSVGAQPPVAPPPSPAVAPKAVQPSRVEPSARAGAPPASAAAPAPVIPPAPLAPLTSDAPKASESAVVALAPLAPLEPPKPQYKDGTYLGWGHCRHGDIQAQVVIANGRIASATIATCLTRYSCNIIEKLPPQVALRQSPDVDTISGATQSGDAFYYAVLDALYLAK